jgi:carbonic anhydrase
MSTHGKFGTAINCMDGRVQLPVIDWMKNTYGLDYVDMITEPGPDRIMGTGSPVQLDSIKSRVSISVNAHGSEIIVIVGHYDCAGNPVTGEEHRSQVQKAIDVIKSWNFPVREIAGVWIGSDWTVELVSSVRL